MPKYLAVKKQIESAILNGDYQVGEMLPPETILEEIYNVSRGTIRQALSELVADAIITRLSGSGTKVIRRPRLLPPLASFSEQVQASGKKPNTKVLDAKVIAATEINPVWSPWVLEALQLFQKDIRDINLYKIDRLRYINDKPASLQEIYLRTDMFRQNLLDVTSFQEDTQNIYRQNNKFVAWAEEKIQARLPTASERKYLDLVDQENYEQYIYVRWRATYDAQNLPIDASISRERNDCFKAYEYRILEGNRIASQN